MNTVSPKWVCFKGVCSHLAGAVEVSHDSNQLLGVGRCQGTALLQDELQLAVGQVADMQLQEPAAEGSGQDLAPPILTCRQAGPGQATKGTVCTAEVVTFGDLCI